MGDKKDIIVNTEAINEKELNKVAGGTIVYEELGPICEGGMVPGLSLNRDYMGALSGYAIYGKPGEFEGNNVSTKKTT